MIQMIYMTSDTSTAHYSKWQFSIETWKTATYDTHTVWNMIAIYKYTYTLVHNYAFTQHTHIIFSEKFRITVAVCVMLIKNCVTWKNMQHHTSNLQTEIYSILTLCYLLYHTHINFIITTWTSQNYIFVDVSIYRCIDIELCHPLLCMTMWMCTYQHCDERRKRWAEILKKSHEGT